MENVTGNPSTLSSVNIKLNHNCIVKLEKLKVYKCEWCPLKAFLQLEDLDKHSAYHKEQFQLHVTSSYVALEKVPIFKCDSCVQSFLSKKALLLHKVKHIQKIVNLNNINAKFGFNNNTLRPYKCPECEFSFNNETTLEEHSVLHRPFPRVCFCGIGFYEKLDLEYHRKLVHPTTSNDKPNGQKQSIKHKRKHTRNGVASSDKPKVKRQNLSILPKPDIEMKTVGDKVECPSCKKLLSSKTALYVHYRTHTGERPYACDECGKCFNQSGALKVHKYVHLSENNFVCPTCGKAFKSPGFLSRHQIIHLDMRPYVCKFCRKGFNDPSACVRHERIHTGDKRYKCPHCPKAFTDFSGLVGHKRRHYNKTVYCKTCGKKFYDKHSMETHEATHINKKKYGCDYCNKYFILKSYLVRHITDNHTKRKKYQCQFCPKTFTKYHLPLHILRHKRLTRYICKFCDKGFYHRTEYVSHLETHLRVKPERFKCDHCETSFRTREDIRKHMIRRHIGIQCYACKKYFACENDLAKHFLRTTTCCKICGMQYFCTLQRNSHIRSHLPPKKFECDVCGEVFTVRYKFAKHFAIKHTNKKFQCDHCKNRFALKCSLRSHMVQLHFKKYRCKTCLKIFYLKSEYKKHKTEGCVIVQYFCKICDKTFQLKSSFRYHMKSHRRSSKYKCQFCSKKFKHYKSLKEHLKSHKEDIEFERDYHDLFVGQVNSVLYSESK